MNCQQAKSPSRIFGGHLNEERWVEPAATYLHHVWMDSIRNSTSTPDIDPAALAAEIGAVRAYAAGHMNAKAKAAGRSRPRRRRQLNEPQVAMVMVQPVLNLIGWGTRDDPDSLWREFVLPNGQADFACLVGNEVKVTVECKNLGVNLRDEKVVTQACTYAFGAGAPFAVLTDGLIWAIYATFMKGRPVDKLVRRIDLRKCTTDEATAFFGFWSKARATAGDLRISKPTPQSRKTRGKKKRARRASLNTPGFRKYVTLVERSIGGPLAPLDNARNTFLTPSGNRIRFCLSSGKNGQAMFNISMNHLESGMLFLAHEGCERGWLVPVTEISEYLLGSTTSEASQRRTWTPRVSWSDEGDVLWTNKGVMATLSLTPHRHSVGHA